MSKKILIIDDDPDVVVYLETLFRNEGYETVTATDGVEGQKALEDESPDLITLDLQMPNETGTDFYREVHRKEKAKATPVIVISGVAGRHLAIRKPVAVFDKPIDKDELLATVKEVLGE
jgi:two-component system, cell cycle response regulator DivK